MEKNNFNSFEIPRGGNYLNDYRPEENKFYPIPEKHQEEYQKYRDKIERSLTFDELKKELANFKEMLHINSIRIAAHSIDEGLRTAIAAKESGLTPWLSPRFWGATFEETKQMFAKYVEQAKFLDLNNSPLIVANELSFDCADDPITGEKSNLEGNELISDRIEKYFKKNITIDCTDRVKELVKIARKGGWTGPLTYAAFEEEKIDWDSLEDDNIIASANLYWGKNFKENRQLTAEEYEQKLLALKKSSGNRPFILTEFGAVPQKEGRAGGSSQLDGELDYQSQAEAYKDYLDVLERNNIGYFAFAIDEPIKEVDQDWARKSYAIILRDEKGSGPKLTPAGEVFAEHNKKYSGNINGIEM